MTEGVLADALERLSPDNRDLTSVRKFTRAVYAEHGLPPMQLFYDLADDADIVVVYVQRQELEDVVGRRLHDADMDAIREASLADELSEALVSLVGDALLIEAGISA